VAAERESADRAEQAIYIQEQLARAGNLEAAERWEAALKVIDEAQARYRGSTELAAARARIQKALQGAQQREAAYRESMAAARKALDEHRFDAAGEMAHKALLAKPDDNLALALLDRIDAEREAERRAQRDTAHEIDTMDLANRLDEATRMLDRSTLGPPPAEAPPAPPSAPPLNAETVIFAAGQQRKTIEPPAFKR